MAGSVDAAGMVERSVGSGGVVVEQWERTSHRSSRPDGASGGCRVLRLITTTDSIPYIFGQLVLSVCPMPRSYISRCTAKINYIVHCRDLWIESAQSGQAESWYMYSCSMRTLRRDEHTGDEYRVRCRLQRPSVPVYASCRCTACYSLRPENPWSRGAVGHTGSQHPLKATRATTLKPWQSVGEDAEVGCQTDGSDSSKADRARHARCGVVCLLGGGGRCRACLCSSRCGWCWRRLRFWGRLLCIHHLYDRPSDVADVRAWRDHAGSPRTGELDEREQRNEQDGAHRPLIR